MSNTIAVVAMGDDAIQLWEARIALELMPKSTSKHGYRILRDWETRRADAIQAAT
jgi:hypothetical protein